MCQNGLALAAVKFKIILVISNASMLHFYHDEALDA